MTGECDEKNDVPEHFSFHDVRPVLAGVSARGQSVSHDAVKLSGEKSKTVETPANLFL